MTGGKMALGKVECSAPAQEHASRHPNRGNHFSRFLILLVILIPALAACSGPERNDAAPVAAQASPTATSATATAIPPAAATNSPTSSSGDAGATIAASPTSLPSATPAPVEATATEPPRAPAGPSAAAPEPTPWLPDLRPEDQRVELPDADAHYQLHVSEIDIDSGYLRASEVVTVPEFRGGVPGELLFQVPPAGYGYFTFLGLTLNGQAVEPGWLNGGATMVVDLPESPAMPLEIGIEFELNVGGPEPSGWGYMARDGGVLRLGYWFPQISDGHPFSVTLDPSYTRVAVFDLTLDIDPSVVVAASGEITGSENLADGRVRYQLHGENIRDFDLTLSQDYVMTSAVSAGGVTVEYYWRGGISPDVSDQVLATTIDALDRLAALLGPYPWPTLRMADGGPSLPGGIEYGNLIWINPAYQPLDGLIYHEVSHMWLYGIIGTRTLIEGWIDEGGAEFFERGLASDFTDVPAAPEGGYCCALDSRWEELPQEGRSFYFSIYEQGARLYYEVLGSMGWDPFWAAMQEVYADFRFGIVTTWDLLRTWQAHSPLDLRPLFDSYFRYEWIWELPEPGITTRQGWLPILPATD